MVYLSSELYRPPTQFPRYSLISHVGPVHPGAQAQLNSFSGTFCCPWAWLIREAKLLLLLPLTRLLPVLLSRAFRPSSDRTLPIGLPMELMPRIPLTAVTDGTSSVLLFWASYFTGSFSVHVPPFLQGCVAHGCSTTSQRTPERPSAQVQRYWSGAVFSQVPPCIQGSWVPQ